MLDFTWADEVNRATYHEMCPGGHKSESHKRVLAQYRQALRRAQRFVLDDAAVTLICEMTRQEAKMELWSILARLPFDTVWLEFDLHHKVKIWEKMGTLKHPFNPDEVSRPCGYLLQKDLDSNTRWIATEFTDVLGTPTPQPVALVFDPEGSPLKPVTGCMLWNELTLAKRFGFKTMPVIISDGEKEVLLETRVDPEFGYLGLFKTKDGGITGPEELVYKVGAVAERMWVDWCVPERLNAVMLQDAIERTGVLKWLITALAMINDVPRVIKTRPAKSGMMLTKSGPIKYLDSHVITINIPKGNLRYVSRRLTEAAVKAHRAWHRVRGYWRVIERGVFAGPWLCRHEPTMAENGLAICARCERLIRWIDDHHRGSPELGIIEHEYEVTHK